MMKKIVFWYGIIAGIINVGLAWLLYLIWGDDLMHANNVWLGYLVMLIALSMIFFGVKQFRDSQLGGVIKFGKAFLVGLCITLVASTIYAGAWEVYMQTSGEDFIETYQSSLIENMRENGATDDEIAQTMEDLEYYAEVYQNPFLRVLVTLSEILPVGLLISLISAALLRKSDFMPAEPDINIA